MELKIELVPITFDAFEKACLALGLDPDDVRASSEPIRAETTGREQAFLSVALQDGGRALPPDLAAGLAPTVATLFFRAVRAHLDHALARAHFYAEATGVLPLLQGQQGGERGTLALELARLAPRDYDYIRRTMPLEEAMAYLYLGRLDRIAEKPTDLIPGYDGFLSHGR